jgi:hypothetical protein
VDLLQQPSCALQACKAVTIGALRWMCCAGGENGFNQAIELSAGALANVKFVQVLCCSAGQLHMWACDSPDQFIHTPAAGQQLRRALWSCRRSA